MQAVPVTCCFGFGGIEAERVDKIILIECLIEMLLEEVTEDASSSVFKSYFSNHVLPSTSRSNTFKLKQPKQQLHTLNFSLSNRSCNLIQIISSIKRLCVNGFKRFWSVFAPNPSLSWVHVKETQF